MPMIVVVVVMAVVFALPIVLFIRYTNRNEPMGNREVGMFFGGFHAAGKKPDDRRRGD